MHTHTWNLLSSYTGKVKSVTPLTSTKDDDDDDDDDNFCGERHNSVSSLSLK